MYGVETARMKRRLSFIVPCFNEYDSIIGLLKEMFSVLPKAFLVK